VRVLLADNEPFALALVSEALASADFEVNGVSTVAEAISTIEAFSPNVVVTDLNFGRELQTVPTSSPTLMNTVRGSEKWSCLRTDLLHWHYPLAANWPARSPIS